MVAKIVSGKDVQGALNYNEQKVTEGKAACIMANLFKEDVVRLNFFDKLSRFTNLNDRNRRTKTNTLHISLNFDVTEKLKVSELNAIASTYMDRIGFGDQPYLVYEHRDAAHQHVHIVTSIIQQDGKRIPINYLGKTKSEKARKEIEKEFNLVIAEKQNKSNELDIPVNLEKPIYGKSLTKKSIARVVSIITRNYKYTSLPELNAILKQYNIIADRGHEKSIMFEKRGLLFSLVDEKGNRIGIPIKASALPGKPTLKYLEKQFKLNQILRQPHKEKLKANIDRAINKTSVVTIEQFIKELHDNSIQTILRSNAQGRTYGVTFIDFKQRTVFNGSDLGKAYSANALAERLSNKPERIRPYRPGFTASTDPFPPMHDSMLKELIQSDENAGSNPEASLRIGRRRRKKKNPRF